MKQNGHIVRRFRVIVPRTTTPPREGARVIFDGAEVIEEWDTSWSSDRSFVPRKVSNAKPRVGIVRRLQPRDDGVHVIAEDEAARSTPVGAILSVTGTRLVIEPGAVLSLLDYLYGARLATDEQRLHVAHEAARWLRNLFPDLQPRREIPPYATAAQYEAWLQGFTAAVGTHRSVPPCPIKFHLPPALDLRRATVRDDVTKRLWRNGSAN